MNFYSDILINNIIDNEAVDQIIDMIETFGEESFNVIAKYSSQNINHKYIYNILSDTQNIVVFYCLDIDFSINNCPSVLVYRKCKKQNEIRYYILLTCTKRSFRKQGYGSKLMDGLIERIKKENSNLQNTKKILLSSVEESVLFYESYGFKWTRESIIEHDILLNFEKYESEKEYFIMEYIVI